MSPHNTDEIFPPVEDTPTTDGQATRFIDVHIYDVGPEQDEPPTVESQIEAEPAALHEDERDQHTTEPGRPPRTRGYLIAACASLMCVLGASALVLVVVLPLCTPDATVTLVPSTQQIRTTRMLTVTTGQATGTQLAGRALAAITMNQARTVPTIGKGHQDATAADGSITFYNAATYPQAVTAGTLLTDADGVQIITDADAVLPAGTLATNGQATVPAHALQRGPGGNIAAGDIYGPCCLVNVFAANAAFTGGQPAQDYPTVTPQDITAVVSDLKTSVNQSAQAALQTQVHSDETLITPLPCQQSVKPDHQPGEEAAQVTITVSETCKGMTYRSQAYQDRLTQIANQQAAQQLGDGYTPIGQVESTITQITTHNRTRTELHVTLAATYGYHLTQQQQQQIKTLIAGENKAQATRTLLHLPGIQSVSVSSDTLPTDTQHIRMIVVYVGEPS